MEAGGRRDATQLEKRGGGWKGGRRGEEGGEGGEDRAGIDDGEQALPRPAGKAPEGDGGLDRNVVLALGGRRRVCGGGGVSGWGALNFGGRGCRGFFLAEGR